MIFALGVVLLGFFPLLTSVAFAIAAIVVNYRTGAKSNIKVASLTAAVLFACFAILMSSNIIFSGGAIDASPSGDSGSGEYNDVWYSTYYNETSDSMEIEITGYVWTGATSIVIPNKIKGKSVTRIKDRAFSGCSTLTRIEIPNSVTSIGVYAFSGCSSLTSIEIPNSVTSIGKYAFYRCSSLTRVKLLNLAEIGDRAFDGCSVTRVDLDMTLEQLMMSDMDRISVFEAADIYCTDGYITAMGGIVKYTL